MMISGSPPLLTLTLSLPTRRAGPGPGLQKGVTETRLTSLLDVYPTLVALAGGKPPSFLRGQSLLPLLQAGSSAEGTTFPEERCPRTLCGVDCLV